MAHWFSLQNTDTREKKKHNKKQWDLNLTNSKAHTLCQVGQTTLLSRFSLMVRVGGHRDLGSSLFLKTFE